MEFSWQPINSRTEKATMVNKRFFISHSFVFVDEFLIKNLSANKRNKGGGYIGAMLPWLALLFQMIEAMLLQLKRMLHVVILD